MDGASEPVAEAPGRPASFGKDAAPIAATGRATAEGSDRSAPWDELDQLYHAMQGRLTQGASPLALWQATLDWATHFANAPFRRFGLMSDAALGSLRLLGAWSGESILQPAPGDQRFNDPKWRTPPFAGLQQTHLFLEELTERATCGLKGVNPENQRMVNFAARQWLDAISPSNAPWSNPEIIAATRASGGENLATGVRRAVEDLGASLSGSNATGPAELLVGNELAATPGSVVFRNDLFELIQYTPTTETVYPEPILIVSAWIMKYYILDLTPNTSLIKYLVDNGFTVFCISWRNPDETFRNVGLDDYLERGFFAALTAVSDISGAAKTHVCGYCLGGTLASIGASAMARDGDERLASLTLFTTQIDFSDAGELQLFTTEAQVAFLEDLMANQGYLDGKQMGGAFQHLRSRDLIWSRMVKRYWLGEDEHPSELLTWNADVTRMPARMHSEYLRRFFLRNDLAEGRYQVCGRPISFADIRAPLFLVATEADHVAPWRSVHKAHFLNGGEITFVLAKGGHNAGVVSEPEHPRRHFRIRTRLAGSRYVGPAEWLEAADLRDGSWWPSWAAWLDVRSSAPMPAPAALGAPSQGYPALEPAPGAYVRDH